MSTEATFEAARLRAQLDAVEAKLTALETEHRAFSTRAAGAPRTKQRGRRVLQALGFVSACALGFVAADLEVRAREDRSRRILERAGLEERQRLLMDVDACGARNEATRAEGDVCIRKLGTFGPRGPRPQPRPVHPVTGGPCACQPGDPLCSCL